MPYGIFEPRPNANIDFNGNAYIAEMMYDFTSANLGMNKVYTVRYKDAAGTVVASHRSKSSVTAYNSAKNKVGKYAAAIVAPVVAVDEVDVPFTTGPTYKRNIQTPETEECPNRCHFFQRPIRENGMQVHMTTNNTLTTAEEHAESQGYYDIGPECAKKVPARFIFINPE